jgi:hypothetical protein
MAAATNTSSLTCAGGGSSHDCEFIKPAAWLGRARYRRVPPRRGSPEEYPFDFPGALKRMSKRWDAMPKYAACYTSSLVTKQRIALHAFVNKLLETTNRANAAYAVDWELLVDQFRTAMLAAHNDDFLSRVYKMYAYDTLAVAGATLKPVFFVKTILAVPVYELQQIALRTNALVLFNVTPHITLTHHVGRVLRNDADARPHRTFVTGLVISEASGQRSLETVLRDDFGIHDTHVVMTAPHSFTAETKRQLYSIFAQVVHGLFALSHVQLTRSFGGSGHSGHSGSGRGRRRHARGARNSDATCWFHCDMKPANVAFCDAVAGRVTYAYTHDKTTQTLRGMTGVCRLIDFDTMSTNFDAHCFRNPQQYVKGRWKVFRRDIDAWLRAVGRAPLSRSRSRSRSASRGARSRGARSRSRSRSRRRRGSRNDVPVIMDVVSFLVSTLPSESKRRQNYYNVPIIAFIVGVIRKLLREFGAAVNVARDTRPVLWKVFCYFANKANRGVPDAPVMEHFGESVPRENSAQIRHELQQLQLQAPIEEPRQLVDPTVVDATAHAHVPHLPHPPLADFRRSARVTILPP